MDANAQNSASYGKILEDSSKNGNDKFTGNYFQWIKEELSGWDTFPWALFGAGFGFQLALFLSNPINWMSALSFFSVIMGQLCVVAMASGGTNKDGTRKKSHSINGLLGALSVVGYIIINAFAGHWFSILDQVIYFVFIDLELLLTWRTWGRGNDSKIKTLKIKGWVYSILAILIGWFVLYYVGIYLNDTAPLQDSLVLAIGATASFLCYKRYSQTFTLWLLEDVANIFLWYVALINGSSQGSALMLAMTVFYLISAIYGKLVWKADK